MKRGVSLHELLVSLAVMGIVFGLATHFALRQTRFFREVGAATSISSQLQQVTEILRNVLVNVSPTSGELLVAQDSVLEIRMTTGMTFVCAGAPGLVVVPAPDALPGSARSAVVRSPAPGDRLSALFSDSVGATWLNFQVASVPEAAGPCALAPAIETTWNIAIMEPVSIPAGAPVRLTRPFRLSLYRSSNGRWYLGAKDWDAGAVRFNTIQPVAGPLLPYEDGPESGLRFTYRDVSGEELIQPVDVSRVASVTVVARASGDSMSADIRLPNAQ